jgi:Tfp pilus assembly protein PilO
MVEVRVVDRVGVSALLGVAILVAAWMYTSAWRPIRASAAEAAQLRQAVGILSNAEGGLEGLRDEVREVSSAAHTTDALLPEAVELERFLAKVEEIASRSKVRIDALTPEGAETHPLYHAQHVRLRAIGEFPSLYAFIVALEGSPPLARIDDLTLLSNEPSAACVAELHLVLFSAGSAPS